MAGWAQQAGQAGAACEGGWVQRVVPWRPRASGTPTTVVPGSTRQYQAVPHLDALVGAAEGLGKGAQEPDDEAEEHRPEDESLKIN